MEQTFSKNQLVYRWWAQRRFHYNKGLVIAGITAFLLYAILGSILIGPHEEEFEITAFTIILQGSGYLLMIGVANICYFMGPLADLYFKKSDSEKFRVKLYNFGYWFSFSLPFLIPIMIVIQYFVLYFNK